MKECEEVMEKKKVSIIVPVYNSEKHIQQCIDSIINQTYKNLEIIVVNDGSTDKTLDILKNLNKKDKRVKIYSKQNSGVAETRNLGLDHATGEIIGFVDSDDTIEVNMYEQLVVCLENYKADIVECGYKRINNDSILKFELQNEIITNKNLILENYLKGKNTTNHNWNKIYSSDLIKNVRYANYSYSEDYLFNVQAHSLANKKIIVSETYYNYMDNIDSAVNAPFTLKKIDQISAGISAIEYLNLNHYTESILSLARVYVIDKIIVVFNEAIKSQHYKNIKSKIIKIFRKNFKKLVFSGNIIRLYTIKQIISRTIFFVNPSLYLYTVKHRN